MPGPLPEGDPTPADGALPVEALAEINQRQLSFYLHVPFCTSRCGYCDFNTYTPGELRAEGGGGTSMEDYLVAAHREIDLAAHVLGESRGPLATVFIGGGTPSLMTAEQYGGLLDHLRSDFGMAPDCEVTTEANPESTTPQLLDGMLEAGVNRLSLGMQSAKRHVLAVLDRRHTPGRALDVVAQARQAGFGDISLDLIMGTPGESLDDWRASIDQALSAHVDHLSAYSLIVEDGTRLAAQIRRGEVAAPSDDDHADKYELTESLLTAAGFENYEVSNWARPSTGHLHRSRHNLAYWTGQNWWGIGPGAHSHIGGVRFWNVKHPARYAQALTDGVSPAMAREILDEEQRRVERVLLELRLVDGVPLSVLTPSEQGRVDGLIGRGLATVTGNQLSLTLAGRLLADAVTLELLDD